MKYLPWATPIIRWLNGMLAVVSIAGLGCLIAQYGFYLTPNFSVLLHRISLLIVEFYLFQYVVKFLCARRRIEYLRQHWFESALALLIVSDTALLVRALGINVIQGVFFDLNVVAITEVYIGIAQALIFLTLLAGMIRYNARVLQFRFHPSHFVIIMFALTIFAGTFLLMLPRATVAPHQISLVDALFTVTSAVCVTGLTVVDTATYFSHFGQLIILVLIQIGGLGIMTMAAFLAMFFGQGVDMRGRVVLRDVMNVERVGSITTVLRNIILITLSIEVVGTVLLMFFWADEGWTFSRLFYYAVFHSVAAFCNAGFSTFSDNLMGFSADSGILLTIAGLIILGGLGFGVIMDLGASQFLQRKRQVIPRLQIQTKMVLVYTVVLLVAGTVVYVLFDTGEAWPQRLLSGFFISVVSRTCGFNSVDTALLSLPTTFMLIMLMFIGCASGSTGGGIKINSFGVLLHSIYSIILGKNRIELWKKNIPFAVVNQALVVVVFAVIIVLLGTFLLTITERGTDFLTLLFEDVSAFGTVGLSRNFSPHLSTAGKIIITCTMFIGRIGTLTLAFAIGTPSDDYRRVQYPPESMMVG